MERAAATGRGSRTEIPETRRPHIAYEEETVPTHIYRGRGREPQEQERRTPAGQLDEESSRRRQDPTKEDKSRTRLFIFLFFVECSGKIDYEKQSTKMLPLFEKGSLITFCKVYTHILDSRRLKLLKASKDFSFVACLIMKQKYFQLSFTYICRLL